MSFKIGDRVTNGHLGFRVTGFDASGFPICMALHGAFKNQSWAMHPDDIRRTVVIKEMEK